MSLNNFVEMTYEKLVYSKGLHFINGNVKELKEIIIETLNLLDSKKEKLEFAFLLSQKIRTKHLAGTEEQKKKWGRVIIKPENYETFLDLYDWLKRGGFQNQEVSQFDKNESPKTLFSLPKNIINAQMALYIFILQEANLIERFSGNAESEYKRIASEWKGLECKKTTWKSIQNHYTKITRLKRENKNPNLRERKKNLKVVLKLVEQYPQAKKEALKQYNEIEID